MALEFRIFANNPLHDRVTWLGNLPPMGYAQYYSAFNILILSISRHFRPSHCNINFLLLEGDSWPVPRVHCTVPLQGKELTRGLG